ncbi:MAG: SsrA-binding protein SmpB [Gammaproteobacteria bacterium]|nr:MAG: SsrA-binding protein SmpB [Gammaproteobacteria bacterium]
MSKKSNTPSTKPGGKKLVVVNKKARHEYFIDETYEAGLVLDGWEVKAMRSGRAQLKEGYVLLKDGEAWLFGAHISPLSAASTHVKPDPVRTRKLLLHRRQIDHLVGLVERKGYALVPLSLYFSNGKAKLEIGLGRGKKKYDKRAVEKDRDWKRQKERILKH